ncbi:MAG: hypothetical protein GF335_01065 [Candidatus Moranbacteria bacterium]|nr:hypothetical protein [Candidatus Moranbacteria bacterium]
MKKNFFWGFLVFVFLGFVFLGWYFIYIFFKTGQLNWFLIITSFILTIFLILFCILLNRKYAKILTLIAITPSLFLSFNIFALAGYFLSLGLFFLGIKRIKNNQNNSIKLNVIYTILIGYSLITTPFCLMPSINYYSHLNQQFKVNHLPKFKIEIPQALTNVLINIFDNLLQEDFYFSNSELTVDEFINQKIKQQNRANPDLISQNLLSEQKKALSQSLDMDLKGEEKMSTVLNKLINQEIEHYFNSMNEKSDFPVWGLTLALFFTIKTITWTFRFPICYAIVLFIKILIKFQLIKKIDKNVVAKRIVVAQQ